MANIEVSIVLLNNIIDCHGNPIGHFKKQIQQTLQILHKIGFLPNEIEVLAGRELLKKIKCKNKLCLPQNVVDGSPQQKVNAQITKNYVYACLRAKGRYIWYIYVNEKILEMIALFPMNRELIATTFTDWERCLKDGNYSHIRKRRIEKGLERLHLCITTNPTYKRAEKSVFLPDYFRTQREKELYGIQKNKCVTTVGLIREGKNIANTLKLFANHDIGMPLIIKGRISGRIADELEIERYNKSNNIKICDCLLSDQEYQMALAESMFIFLNYNPKTYRYRTSGVLLESIFVGCIPIAPIEILKNNHINGLAYTNIGQVPELINKYMSGEIKINNDLDIYEFDHFCEVLSPYFMCEKK